MKYNTIVMSVREKLLEGSLQLYGSGWMRGVLGAVDVGVVWASWCSLMFRG